MRAELRRHWPSGLTALVIEAAFHSDPAIANAAWRSWQDECDFDRTVWSELRIASQAHRRLGGLRAGGVLEPRLLGLRRYLWSAGQVRIEAARPLLQKFTEEDIKFMPIKGSVLLARNAEAVADRFIADVDVLVDHACWQRAVDIALQEGWLMEKQLTRDTVVHRMRQTHHSLSMQSGAYGAVDLHHFSTRLNRQLGADAMVWKRAVPGVVAGIPVLLPHPSDHLAILLGHCFLYSSKRSYEWVSDVLATISTPGFNWDLLADAVIERELAVPAATALSYLHEGLQHAVPSVVLKRIIQQVREPFLTEFAAGRRRYRPKDGAELRAIYQAECIRSRRFLERTAIPSRRPDQPNPAKAKTAFAQIPVEQRVVLAMPQDVRPADDVYFQLTLEFAGMRRRAAVLILLRCFEGLSLEVKRWRIRPRPGCPRTLTGTLDGALVVGRGIDQLWLMVANAPQGTTLTGNFEASVSGSRWACVRRQLAHHVSRIRLAVRSARI